MSDSNTLILQNAIKKIRNGDDSARAELLTFAVDRLRSLTRSMLKERQSVRRWEETDDVFQNAMIRLWKAIKETELESVQHFFRLAALQIRRELIDLARHYYGPEGHGSHYHTDNAKDSSDEKSRPIHDHAETTRDPRRLALWTEFHTKIDALPEEERDVFDLLFYQEQPQSEAASLLGLSERTLQRRWQSARQRLHEMMDGESPM